MNPVVDVGGELHQLHADAGSVWGMATAEYAWRADGVHLDSVGDGDGDGTGDPSVTCDFQPDVLVYEFPLAIDNEWGIDSSCSYVESGQTVVERVEGASRILRTSVMVVGGEEIGIVVVETRETIASEATPDRRIESVRSDYFAPSVGLTVRSETHLRHLRGEELMGEEWEGYELLTVRPR